MIFRIPAKVFIINIYFSNVKCFLHTVSLLQLLLPGCPHILHLLVDEIVFSEDSGFVEEVLHHLEESRILEKKYFYTDIFLSQQIFFVL